MPAVVRGVQQQQCRRQDVAVGIPVSAHGDHGTVDLDHRLLGPVLQSVGREEVLVQHNVELLHAAHRTLGPRQVSRQHLQPRQHLESARLLRSHCKGYNASFHGGSIKNNTSRAANLESVFEPCAYSRRRSCSHINGA